MNQTLDSTVEALTFNFASYGVFTLVNNLWTWVAVIMAAVSFWRMRATAATLSCFEKPDDQKPSTSITGRPEEKNPTLSASVGETSRVWPLVCNDGGMTKGEKFKWTVYYEDGDRETDDGGMDMTVAEWSKGDGGREEKEGSGGGGEWWERVLKVRKGEMMCYGYQDLTVLNGNVVRLWDGSCRRRW
ncbi:hypothetical protein V6N13_066555 [Hibiscus sabdariffa]|uniref:Transmembrane protein n=1 Tax=Hibiscus sabdariffa TaxID=183260 RepID=A0ABR2DR31_9ROSI